MKKVELSETAREILTIMGSGGNRTLSEQDLYQKLCRGSDVPDFQDALEELFFMEEISTIVPGMLTLAQLSNYQGG